MHVLITFIFLFQAKADAHVLLIKSDEPLQASHGSPLSAVDQLFCRLNIP